MKNLITSLEIRRLIIQTAAECGQSAHLGGSLSMVELLNVLFRDIMKHNASEPHWNERDIFILSKGHAVLGYFTTLMAYGYFSAEILKSFQSNGSDLIAHPVKNIDLGIESSNGSLGQGLSYGLGIAMGLSKKSQLRRNVFVMMGDGECNEGSVWEAAALAAELGQANLVAVVDVNRLRNDGENFLYNQTNGSKLGAIWNAFGWYVQEIDGHDEGIIRDAYKNALQCPDMPSVIIANTIKGKGISFMENNNDWHHNRITDRVLAECLLELDGNK